MNQIAFSTVILRLTGFFLIYQVIAELSAFHFIQQAFLMAGHLEEGRAAFLAWIIAGYSVKALLGVVLVILAPRISRLLFIEGENVITAGQINGTALLQVGLALLGFFFLVRYLPAVIELGIDWFRTEATDGRRGSVPYWPFRGPIEAITMTFFAFLLIFRNRTICDWVIRVSK